MSKKEYKIISVGGSTIIPDRGFNITFLKDFRNLILTHVKNGERFILVVGGGSTCRVYQRVAKEVAGLSDEALDWLGIYTTWYNAEFVRMLFGELAHQTVAKNPNKKIKTSKPIIVAGGWKPGCSTDRDAVLFAKVYGSKEIINASNVDYIYTVDPKTHPEARPLKNISWSDLQKIVGDKWRAGANLPFDPVAAKEAKKIGLKVVFLKGTNIKAFDNALNGRKTEGTIIQD